MLPLSRIAAAALAVCAVGCALTGKTDSQSVDSRRGSTGNGSKAAAADRKGATKDASEAKSANAGALTSSSNKGTATDSMVDADNPFRRDRRARPAATQDEKSLPSVVPRIDDDDSAFAESSRSEGRTRNTKAASDSDDWSKNAAPRPQRKAADAELDALIKEEVRLADADEKATLARDLPAMPPHLARELIQFRRLARQVSAGQEDERISQAGIARDAPGRRPRSVSEDESRPAYDSSRDRVSPSDSRTLSNWDRLDPTADARTPSFPTYPSTSGTLPRTSAPAIPPANSAATPLGDASSFPSPPTSNLWSGTPTGGVGRGADAGTAREMQQLFQTQAQASLLQNTGRSPGLLGNNSVTLPTAGSPPASGSLFNPSPMPNGPPAPGAFAGNAFNTLPARSEAPGLFTAGANFSPMPAPNSSTPSGGGSHILQVSATNPGNVLNSAMQSAAAMVDPQSGLAAPASRADLQRLIAVAEADAAAARLGPHPTDAERRFYIEKHVALRMLYLMAGQQERALQAIPGIDAGDQEFWQQMFWSIANYFDGQNVPDRGHRAALAATQLRTAVDRLQESAKLELRNVAFCHKIASFGNYERFDRDEFTPNQPVLLYAELSNFKSAPAAGGKYLTRIRSSIEIHDAAGRLVMRIPTLETEDLCLNHRRDYYHSYEFSLPPASKIALGPHTLKLIVEDLLSNKVAEETLRFTVK